MNTWTVYNYFRRITSGAENIQDNTSAHSRRLVTTDSNSDRTTYSHVRMWQTTVCQSADPFSCLQANTRQSVCRLDTIIKHTDQGNDDDGDKYDDARSTSSYKIERSDKITTRPPQLYYVQHCAMCILYSTSHSPSKLGSCALSILCSKHWRHMVSADRQPIMVSRVLWGSGTKAPCGCWSANLLWSWEQFHIRVQNDA